MKNEERLESDVESLKRDLNKFKQDLSSVLTDVSHFSQRKAQETKQKVGVAMKNFQNTASEKMNYAGSMAQEKSKQAVNSSREMIIKKPFASVGIAFACGVFMTFLFRKRD